MSEETTPAKKAARKSVRKKSASKRAKKEATKPEVVAEETTLPLVEEAPESKEAEAPKPREPKTKVRDVRRETADEPIPAEISGESGPDAKEDKASEAGGSKGSQKGQKKSEPAGEKEKPEGNERRGRSRGRRNEKREPRPKIEVDHKELSKKAWKIFYSEVTEEGLALLDDNGLRDYARSSFNAARLFLEEKERLAAREKQVKAEKKKAENAEAKSEDDD